MQMHEPDLSVPHALVFKVGHQAVWLTGPAVIEVVSSGASARIEPGSRVGLRTGDVLFLEAGCSCKLSADDRAEVACFQASRSWAAGAAQLTEVELPCSREGFSLARGGTDDAARARSLLRDLGAIPRQGGHVARLRASALGIELLALAAGERARGEDESAGARRGGARRAFLVAVAALEEAALDEVSLPGFAAGLGLSDRQVSRLFRLELGTTFRDHLTALRLARAKQLLRDTDDTVTAVAAEAGWGSLAHFNLVFRRKTGVTPSAFRTRTRDRARDRGQNVEEPRTLASG